MDVALLSETHQGSTFHARLDLAIGSSEEALDLVARVLEQRKSAAIQSGLSSDFVLRACTSTTQLRLLRPSSRSRSPSLKQSSKGLPHV